jgi:alcohol dehydrogenase (cytochrome c)
MKLPMKLKLPMSLPKLPMKLLMMLKLPMKLPKLPELPELPTKLTNAMRSRLARIAAVVAFVLIAAAAATALYAHLPDQVRFASSSKFWNSLSWRVQIYKRKALGGVPDLSWRELIEMTKPSSGFVLTTTVTENRTLDAAVVNPYVSAKDREAGADIFRHRCSVCHDGTGSRGAILNHTGLKHGDSDLAIYKVLRDGVPGTAMASAADLPIDERWQLVAYIRSLQMQSSPSAVGGKEKPALNIKVSSADLRAAGSRGDQWLTYSGSLNGWHYSQLSEITPENVSRLRVRWVRQFTTDDLRIEATPLVVDGTLFITEPPANVIAYDTKSGNAFWKYVRHLPDDLPACCARINRGVALLGDTVFLASLDAHLTAINANTGEAKWDVEVAKPSEGYTITGAPLIANRSVIVGVSGGEFGIRGFLAAYDPQTGKEQWRFQTIPGPGEPGHDTWKNDAWKSGSGPTWITGSYDPDLDLVYWGVGNPAPVYNGDARPGDNLYTDSVIALRASTGELAWHFQFTPHDDHDWDSNQTPILADIEIGGVRRKVIAWANRNGFYYVLDRVSGEFLTGVPFVEQNWAQGLDAAGRPISVTGASVSGRLTKPGVGGGTNWQNPAFDQRHGLVFVPATEGASIFTKTAGDRVERGSRGLLVGSGGAWAAPPVPVVRALDVATGKRRWEYFSPTFKEGLYAGYSGLLATAGGLVFGASGGTAFALDAATGEERWRVSLGGDTRAAPITFTIGGRQVIAISAGRSLFLFEL